MGRPIYLGTASGPVDVKGADKMLLLTDQRDGWLSMTKVLSADGKSWERSVLFRPALDRVVLTEAMLKKAAAS